MPSSAVFERLEQARLHRGASNGIDVASVTVARPSLDDVYLRYTGRTFRSAEAESDQGAKEDGR